MPLPLKMKSIRRDPGVSEGTFVVVAKTANGKKKKVGEPQANCWLARDLIYQDFKKASDNKTPLARAYGIYNHLGKRIDLTRRPEVL